MTSSYVQLLVSFLCFFALPNLTIGSNHKETENLGKRLEELDVKQKEIEAVTKRFEERGTMPISDPKHICNSEKNKQQRTLVCVNARRVRIAKSKKRVFTESKCGKYDIWLGSKSKNNEDALECKMTDEDSKKILSHFLLIQSKIEDFYFSAKKNSDGNGWVLNSLLNLLSDRSGGPDLIGSNRKERENLRNREEKMDAKQKSDRTGGPDLIGSNRKETENLRKKEEKMDAKQKEIEAVTKRFEERGTMPISDPKHICNSEMNKQQRTLVCVNARRVPIAKSKKRVFTESICGKYNIWIGSKNKNVDALECKMTGEDSKKILSHFLLIQSKIEDFYYTGKKKSDGNDWMLNALIEIQADRNGGPDLRARRS